MKNLLELSKQELENTLRTVSKDGWNALVQDACIESGTARLKLQGVDLSGVDLSFRHLPVDFTDANLRGVDLRYANLRGADFTRADLTGAKLDHTDLTRTEFRDAKLTNASLTYVSFGSGFENVTLSGANIVYSESVSEALLNSRPLGVWVNGAKLSKLVLTHHSVALGTASVYRTEIPAFEPARTLYVKSHKSHIVVMKQFVGTIAGIRAKAKAEGWGERSLTAIEDIDRMLRIIKSPLWHNNREARLVHGMKQLMKALEQQRDCACAECTCEYSEEQSCAPVAAREAALRLADQIMAELAAKGRL